MLAWYIAACTSRTSPVRPATARPARAIKTPSPRCATVATKAPLTFLLLLQLAWYYVVACWTGAHAEELGEALAEALLPGFVIASVGIVAVLVLLGYVVAAICLKRRPAKS
jgi:hypothetical protein